MSIQIEQDKSELLRKPGPERGIADIVGHISDQQAACCIDHLSNEMPLREGIDSMALFFAVRRINNGPDMFVLSHSQVSDMVIMVIQTATGRLNMQVVMTGWLACVVLSHPQPSLLLDQQPPAGPDPPRLSIGSSGTVFPPPGSSVHVFAPFRGTRLDEGARSTRQKDRAGGRADLKRSPIWRNAGEREEDRTSASPFVLVRAIS